MAIMEYLTVKHESQAELLIKKSRFIAHVKSVETINEAETFISSIKRKYYDATHNTYAFSVGLEVEEIQKSNDDGEPSGTAGKPILEIIRMKNLKNTVVVVTRYFGGILLGAGGLIRAYGECAKQGIEKAGIIKKIKCDRYLMEVDYQIFNKIEKLFKEKGFVIKEKRYLEKVIFEIFKPYYLGLSPDVLVRDNGYLNVTVRWLGNDFAEIDNDNNFM